MLTARNVAIAAIAIAVVSLIAAVLALMQPPGGSGTGDDSYGTHGHGQRGMFEVLQELGVPVERVLVPPTTVLDREVTLVLWGPHPNMVEIEPVYVRQIGEWVQQGGRVVVSPGFRVGVFSQMTARPDGDGSDKLLPELVLDELGIEEVEVEATDLRDDLPSGRDDSEPDSFREMLRQFRAQQTPAIESLPVRAEGDLQSIGALVSSLDVPVYGLKVLDEAAGSTGRVLVAHGGEEHLIAARFPHGEGEILAVSDPRLFENLLIARADNAVLAFHLLAGAGLPVVFDEFYHGLTIRGNPLYLVAQPPFPLITVAVLLVTGAWIWRRAVALGPPLEAGSATRRTVVEYVDAMARMFHRSRCSRRFLLQEYRDGALWTLRHELGLSPGCEDPDEIAAVIARRDAASAGEFREAIAAIDRLLAASRRPAEQDTLQVLQRASDCL